MKEWMRKEMLKFCSLDGFEINTTIKGLTKERTLIFKIKKLVCTIIKVFAQIGIDD